MSAALRRLLLPLTPVYGLALILRERRLASGREPIRRLRYPVISIGNLSTGGAGKTPLTIALAQALTARAASHRGESAELAPPQGVDVLSRGYGRRSRLPAKVDVHGSAQQFGDEPLLIARAANVPVYVAPHRYHAGLLAESALPRTPQGAPAPPQVVHLLDDGFQHRQLHRDLDILLLSRSDLNDRLLPAGNLREALRAATRAHILAIPADDPTLAADLRARGLTQPLWRLHRRMQIPPSLAGTPVLAFCGIARPAQFFTGLEQSRITVAARVAFADHHPYTARDLQTLAAQAKSAGASTLLTTEKDAIRLEGLPSPLPILPIPLRTEIEDTPAALDQLLQLLGQKSS
ncbi:tetraacyldisaccharide 4'-kinase [Acidobacteria bacterium AB60]|nr:tetraacyldisaccharide 4'-kinase [Acidobacteria bacterium AB60]